MHCILLALLVILAVPATACAWGGGTHLQLGTMVLANLQTLPPAVAAVIGAFPNDFLYGCLAADITVGKKFTHYLLNCHRWRAGQAVLHHANSAPQRSCAYGYLSHLAADTIAHNYYVPLKIMRSFSTLTLKHAYWEIRFDSFVDREVWETGGRVARENFRENDELLRRVIADTLFSFGTNKRIFNSIMLVSRLEKWQQAIRTVNEASRYGFDENDRDEYLELSRTAVFEILEDLEMSRFLQADPTGERPLEAADAVRRNLRILYRSGKLTKLQADELLAELKTKLADAICEPEKMQQILSRI
jgi:hypothetical protein